MKDLKKFLKNLKKYKEIPENSEKNYLKDLIIKERNNNKTIEANELAIKFGTNKNLVESIIKEINEEKPKKVKTKIKKQNKIKEKINKIKNTQKKILDEQDKKTLIDLLGKIILYGIPLNFSIYILSKGFFTFNLFSWIGWGITFWLIKKELVPILRSIIHK